MLTVVHILAIKLYITLLENLKKKTNFLFLPAVTGQPGVCWK